jgi:hypothetical protein
MAPKKEEVVVVKTFFPYHASTVSDCIAQLKCRDDLIKTGLTTEEAAARLEEYGSNSLAEKERTSLWLRIWNQIANVLVAILLFVALVSFVRVFTQPGTQNIVSNAIQVGLIIFVIVYVPTELCNWFAVWPTGIDVRLNVRSSSSSTNTTLLHCTQSIINLTCFYCCSFAVQTRLLELSKKAPQKKRLMHLRPCYPPMLSSSAAARTFRYQQINSCQVILSSFL